MAESTEPLTEDERAELEQLRAEKAAWEQAKSSREEDRRPLAKEQHRSGKKNIMEVDDDLSMPIGQKLVLLGIALFVAATIVMLVFSHNS